MTAEMVRSLGFTDLHDILAKFMYEQAACKRLEWLELGLI
jgi:hypothetical protein